MVTLKLRTEFTFGRVYAPISKVIERVKALGITAAGIVDDDTWGHVKWYNLCKAAGVTPLLGCTAVVSDVEDFTPRMWFLARNSSGLSELYRTISRSYHQKNPTQKGSVPRLYTSDVLAMSDNIFKFCGDVSDEGFIRALSEATSTFYVDITENGSAFINRIKAQYAAKYNIPLVGTWDNNYVNPEDAEMMDYIPFGSNSQKDMSIQVPSTYRENAEFIAESCRGLELPVAPMIHMPGDIEALCRAAIPERFGERWNSTYEARLVRELTEIKAKDFDSYFILVQDMVRFAKKNMLVGPSRGSAAGSLVCYLLHITEIDPLPPGLYFERFIDKTRKDLPDIDLDFPDDKREMVINYLSEKWGKDHVAHVGNVAVFKPKSALIQVCKKLEISPLATAAVKNAIIERGAADARSFLCLLDTLTDTDAGRAFIKMYPRAAVATKLEGHAVRSGVHAAGILVCNEPIYNYCVVDDKGVAHVDRYTIEQVNLLKMDILGLRTLSVLADSRVDVDWYNLPLDDPKAYEVFNSGRLSGIFQFEGNALRSLSTKIEFKSLSEIDAVTALARPGPFNTGISNKWIERHNGKPYRSIHPLMAKLLWDSYELPLYQENTMAIVREIGNFTWEQTAFVRKSIAKVQGKGALAPLRGNFLTGALANGVDEATATIIWDQINAMGAWQMNKAHTYSYATISYWTAWLKGNFPLEFAATTLRHAKDENSAIELLREFVREGFEYTWFDPALSQVDWSVVDGKLVGGFKVIKGVGENKAAKLVAKRDSGDLTQAEIDKLLAAGSVFKDVFTNTNRFRSYYDGRENVRGAVSFIKDIGEGLPHGAERVFLGELVYKNQRDLNEDMLIKKRRGKVIPPGKPTKFLDIRVRDDTEMIGGRVSVNDYERWGKDIVEKIPLGTHILVRAKFFHGIRYAFVVKWKVID